MESSNNNQNVVLTIQASADAEVISAASKDEEK